MNKKQIYSLAVVLAVLVLGIVLKNFQKPAELSVEPYEPLNLEFNMEQAQRISVRKGTGAPVEIGRGDREDIAWQVISLWNARADANKVQTFMQEIKAARGELRANDKNLLPDFGLSEDQAIQVEVFGASGNRLLAFFIGTKKADFGSLFVRHADSDQIFITEAGLLSRMGIYGDPEKSEPTAEYWAALDLDILDPDKIDRLEIKRFKDGREMLAAALVRDTDPANAAKVKWRFTREGMPFEPSADKIRQFLDSFKSVRGQKVLDPKARDYGFSKPAWRMALGRDSGEIILNAAAPEGDSRAYLLEITNQPVLFELAEYYFQSLDLDDSHFVADNPLGVDVDHTTHLVISAGKKKREFSPVEKPSGPVTDYLNALAQLKPLRMLLDPAEQKKAVTPGRVWAQIDSENGTSRILDIGDSLKPDNSEYAISVRGWSQGFSIPASAYAKIAEDLERLDA